MAVYRDPEMTTEHNGRATVCCHVVADTEEELHLMAQRLQMARRWYQDEGHTYPHYDLIGRQRIRAAGTAGVVLLDRRGFLRMAKAMRKGAAR